MRTARDHIEWSDDAEGDVLHIVGHFDSRSNAERVIARLDSKAAGLEVFPERGRIVPELERMGVLKYRELLLVPWRILYEVRGRVVYFVAIFDGRREHSEVLFERFARP